MRRRKVKSPGQNRKASRARGRTSAAPARPQAKGMPDPKDVKEVVDFVSPGGAKYQILKTTEMDAYDQPSSPERKAGT